MTKSLEKGERVLLKNVGTYADGAAVKLVGETTFEICKQVVDEMITVSNDEITQAIIDGFMDTRTILEPAGALAIAGCKKYLYENNKIHTNNIVISSGANIDFKKLRFISNTTDDSEAFISIIIPEQIGSFKKLYNLIYPRDVTEFNYRYSDPDNAYIYMSFQGENYQDTINVINKLKNNNYQVFDLRHNTLAKDHIRSSIGGRSKYVKNEKLFRFIPLNTLEH